MNSQEKEQIVSSLARTFEESKAAFLVEYHGCSCQDVTGLRRKLRPLGSRFAVVKNTLVKRSVENTKSAVIVNLLSGPTAVVWTKNDPVASAKAVSEFADSHESFKIKGGVLDGKALSESDVQLLAKMPSREELLAKLLSLINAPATRLLQTINAPAASMVRVLEARRSQLEKGE